MVGINARNRDTLQDRATITCPECRTQTSTHQILVDRGFKKDMQVLAIECLVCQWIGVLRDYQNHVDHVHPNARREQFEQVTINCGLMEFGCHEQIARGSEQEHYLSQQHQQSMMNIIRQMIAQTTHALIDNVLPPETTTTAPATSQLQELHDMISILTGSAEALADDNQRLSNESLQLQVYLHTLTEQAAQVRVSIQESHSFVDGVKQNADILSQDVSSLKDKINDMQHVSFDGTFVWKIVNVAEKMGDARSERQTSIYSPPFYSSPTGYKMRLRLYLYGDGNARRTHMSLFFVLMRGSSDAVLKFPFSHKVTFCLYDQSGGGKHIIDSFRPDTRSNSFQRPRSDMNIASGIPKFCGLSVVEDEGNGYVRDDTMFIKVMVDFADTPKTLVPFVMGLNPGIPTCVQQVMIKQEAEKRAQQ